MREHLCRTNDHDAVLRETILLLNEFGVPSMLVGSGFLKSAMPIIFESGRQKINLHKWLYVNICKEYNTTICCVSNGIKRTIDTTWNRGNKEVLAKYFEKRPTSRVFIQKFCEIIEQRLLERDAQQ